MSDHTAVYRLFDETDTLLYVGVARRPANRFWNHSLTKAWWPQVTCRQIEWHPSRRAALDAEAIAIRTESPLHNKMIPGVSPKPGLGTPSVQPDFEALRREHDDTVAAVLRAAETDLMLAWLMATDYVAECERRRGVCADLRATAASRLMRHENLSIDGLAKVIGVSKGRTQRILRRAEQGGEG